MTSLIRQNQMMENQMKMMAGLMKMNQDLVTTVMTMKDESDDDERRRGVREAKERERRERREAAKEERAEEERAKVMKVIEGAMKAMTMKEEGEGEEEGLTNQVQELTTRLTKTEGMTKDIIKTVNNIGKNVESLAEEIKAKDTTNGKQDTNDKP